MSETEIFDRHRIREIGLSMEVYPLWPLESIAVAGSINLYQPIADTGGLVFLRYGENETVDAFVETLSDIITTVSVVSDEAITFCERDARQVTLLQHRQGIGVYRWQAEEGLIHSHSPEVDTVISVISFTYLGTPILVGYRIPQESLEMYRPVLERILNSVEVL